MKNQNQESIIQELSTGPKRFKDLEESLEMSHTTIAKHLKELENKREIEKTIENGNSAYKLSKKGKRTLSDFINLARDVERIRARGGKNFRDYSNLSNPMAFAILPWGIESDLTLDKNLIGTNLLNPEDVNEIERMVFEKMMHNIQNKKTGKNKNSGGEMVLGFKIDYAKILRSIDEDSLLYFDNPTKKEYDILEEMENGIGMKEEQERRLTEIRKKTYEKIKELKKK